MKNFFQAAFCGLLLLIGTACSASATGQQAIGTEKPSDKVEIIQTANSGQSEARTANFNSGGSWSYEYRSITIENSISKALWTYRAILGTSFPTSYDELLEFGLIPVRFRNRYTGSPAVVRAEYSPGDLYYTLDEANRLLEYRRYNGSSDSYFNPDFKNSDLIERGPSEYTDGATIIHREVLSEDALGMQDTAYARASVNIALDDEQRARVYVLYDWIKDVMYDSGEIIDQVPASLDEYISFFGDKNNVSWTNPYTGEPMRQVEWNDVPLFYEWNPLSEQIEYFPTGNKSITDDLVGNYSYMQAPSPVVEGENRAYAKFYFKDGNRICAYLAIGIGPKEFKYNSKGVFGE